MKPSELQMIDDLSRCWMTHGASDWIKQMQTIARWDAGKKEMPPKRTSLFLRHLWNRYRNQIRHNRKVKK